VDSAVLSMLASCLGESRELGGKKGTYFEPLAHKNRPWFRMSIKMGILLSYWLYNYY